MASGSGRHGEWVVGEVERGSWYGSGLGCSDKG